MLWIMNNQFRNFNNMKTNCMTSTRDLVCQDHTSLYGTIYTYGSMHALSMRYHLSGNKIKWQATSILDAWPCISRSCDLTKGSFYLRMYVKVNWLLFFVCKIRVVKEPHAMETNNIVHLNTWFSCNNKCNDGTVISVISSCFIRECCVLFDT